MNRIAATVLAVVVWIRPFDARPRTFLVGSAFEAALANELSGQRALGHIIQLSRWDRTTSSPGYLEAVRYVEAELRRAGIEARVEEYGADQSRFPFLLRPSPYWPPVGWKVNRAELWLSGAPDEKLADYAEQPISLARYSRSGSVEAELVDVGRGTSAEDYRGLDVRGKVVLASGAPQPVQQVAVAKLGAAGSITWGLNDSYFPGKDDAYPDLVGWQVLNPRKVDGFEPTFTFSVSRRTGERLRALVRQGPTRVRARVDAEFSEVPLRTPSARIPGTELAAEEFLFVAHIDHVAPSANDNASGSALLLEIARALSSAIERGRIPRPRRSIRFLWVSEGPGTTGYLMHHPEAREHILGAINLDMVGENPSATHSLLRLARTPDSLPSFLPDLVEHMLRWVDSMVVREPTGSRSFFNYRLLPASPSSDHYILNDGVLRIPAVMLHFAPDDFHHTNMDTPDKCDPTELRRVGLAAAAAAYFAAAAGDVEADLLAGEVAARATTRLIEVRRQAEKMLYHAAGADRPETHRLAERWLSHTSLREEAAIRSTTRFAAPASARRAERLAARIAETARSEAEALRELYRSLTGSPAPAAPAPSASEQEAAGLVPVFRREFFHHQWDRFLERGALPPEERSWLESYQKRLPDAYMRIPEFLNFIDGRRSLLDIRDAVSVERFDFSESLQAAGTWEGLELERSRIDADDLVRLMRLFERQGWISLSVRAR
jgi:hypothetical protein